MSNSRFQEGDLCVVTGDNKRAHHGFRAGTEVRLEGYTDNFAGRGFPAWVGSSGSAKWWVAESDLANAGPSDEEIEAAISSIKTRETMNTPRKHSPHFFNREPDGTVRLRIRFDGDEAALMEEAAGDTPVMVWLHRTLTAEAKRQVRAARRKRGKVEPPTGMEGNP